MKITKNLNFLLWRSLTRKRRKKETMKRRRKHVSLVMFKKNLKKHNLCLIWEISSRIPLKSVSLWKHSQIYFKSSPLLRRASKKKIPLIHYCVSLLQRMSSNISITFKLQESLIMILDIFISVKVSFKKQ